LVVADLHTDSVYRIKRGDDLLGMTSGPVDLIKLKKGGVKVVVFACWVKPADPDPFGSALEMIEAIWETVERSRGRMRVVERFADLDLEKINLIIGVEGGHIFEKRIERINLLYRLGVRVFTITWNNSNSLAHSAYDNDNKGLSRKGRRFLLRIEELGGVVDVSHASTKTVIDISRLLEIPIIASHSCLRALNPDLRNLSDPAIDAIAERDGVVGINLSRRHLGPHPFRDHVDYLKDEFSPRLLALGSDFDGIKDPIIPDSAHIPELLKGLGLNKKVLGQLAIRNFLRVLKRCVS